MVPTVVETPPFGVSRTSARMAENTSSEFMCRVLGDGYGELRTTAQDGGTPAAKKRQALANSLREFVKMENGVVAEPHKLERYLKRCEQHRFNAYVAMATRSKDGARLKKGSRAYCQNLQVLFVDLDFKYGEDRVREAFAKFPVQPSFTVESGGGIHAYWLIAPIYLKTAQQYPLAQRLLKALANHFKDVADVSVSQPAAVLRLPGTLNYKYDPPRLVRFVEGTGRTYDLDTDFGDLLKDAAVEPPSKGYVPPDSVVKGERHTTLYKFERSQKARGISKEVAIAGCHAMNTHQCEPPIAHKKLDDYLRRVWDQENEPGFDENRKSRTSQQAGPERFDDIPPEGEPRKKLTFTTFTDVERKHPEHVFGKRLFRGSPTLYVGEGGVGKSFILSYIAAQFTRGDPFVDALRSEQPFTRPSNVAVMLTEDAEGIFKERFEAAGGDSARITDLSSTDTVAGMDIRSPVFLEDDLPELIRELKERKIDLLIIETLVEHMGNRSGKRLPNTSNELEVRNQLRRLLAVCQAADVYCIAVMHPRKGNTGKAIESPSGSRGFTNAARSVLFCYMDPPTDEKPAEDNPVRLLSTGKANYVAKEPPTLRFKVRSFIGDAPCGCIDLRECDHPARVDWFRGDELYDERTAQEVVETEQDGEKKHPPAKQKAMNFLEALIQPDGWIRIPAVQLEEMALERGITKNSLYAAKKELGLSSRRENKVRGKVYAWLTTEADDADLLVDGDDTVVPNQEACHDF